MLLSRVPSLLIPLAPTMGNRTVEVHLFSTLLVIREECKVSVSSSIFRLAGRGGRIFRAPHRLRARFSDGASPHKRFLPSLRIGADPDRLTRIFSS